MKTVDISGMDSARAQFGYEWGCQIILARALRWLKEHPGAKAAFGTFQNIVGVMTAENAYAKELEHYALDHAKLSEFGVTGAMVQFALTHALKRNAMGDETYFSHFKDDPNRVFEFDETQAFPEDKKGNSNE